MSSISHVSVGANPDQMSAMIQFYDAILQEIGSKRQVVIGTHGQKIDLTTTAYTEIAGIGYGKYWPEFWVMLPHDQNTLATPGVGIHVAFTCRSQAQVQNVYEIALAHGGTDNGQPGPRPEYDDKYYAGFFQDPAGNHIEAVFYDLGVWNYCAVL